MIRKTEIWAALALLGVTLPASALSAQQESGQRSVLEGVYTEAQADQGREVFGAECALCHSTREFTGSLFLLTWSNQPVSRFFSLIRNTMPMESPGSLSPDQYRDVVAYILRLNEYPSGDVELPADADELGAIVIERPSGEEDR